MDKEDEAEKSPELKRLVQDITNTNIVLSRNKEILENKRRDVEQLSQTLDGLKERSAQLWELFSKNQRAHRLLEEDDGERLFKLNKTEQEITSLKNTIEQKMLSDSEQRLEVKFLQETNKSALEKLKEFCAQNEDVTFAVDEYLAENNMS